MDMIFEIESLNIFQNVSQQLITSVYYSDKTAQKQIEADTFERAKEELKYIISECNFNIQKIQELFHEKGWHREKLEYFNNLMEKHWPEVLTIALNHCNSNYGEVIVDFDWFIKYVLGTSELKTLKYPLLQLILSTVNKTGQQNNIIYDINKDKLLKFINKLENIMIAD